MNTKYTSIDRIFAKLSRDLPIDNINESDVIEWSGEALEAIGAVTLYEDAVAFIEVKNHQCSLPSGLHSITQIAKNNCFTECIKEDNTVNLCPAQVVENIVEEVTEESNCACLAEQSCSQCKKADYVILDCEGKPITGYDIAYYRPYFDLQYEYYNWNSSKMYRTCYSPIRLTNHTFFNSLVNEEACKTDELYHSSTEEYTIVNGDTIRFSFKEGSIALAYTRQVVDPETGYPMIPDEYSYTTAITKYITYKLMEREFYANREGSQSRLQKAESDWHWYCKQAGNLALMPKGVDQWQNILDQRNHLLPKMRNYFSFFGKMSRPENRNWNDPNHRNRFRGYNKT